MINLQKIFKKKSVQSITQEIGYDEEKAVFVSAKVENRLHGGGQKMVKNPLLSLGEIEVRDLSRHHIDSFEQWCRRIIDENFRKDYGNNYVDAEVNPGTPLIRAEIKKRVAGRMTDNPGRFPRWIDAVLMEDIEYFFSREDLYAKYYKNIFEPFFSGREEIRFVLERLINIRNKLSHGNTISIHEAEQSVCYTNDFIECFKKHYESVGKSRDYNVPVIMRIKDSIGNDIIREHMEYYPWDVYLYREGFLGEKAVKLRSGESYKIWVEVDSSFAETSYDVTWCFECGGRKEKGKGNVVEASFGDKDVSYPFEIIFYLKTHNTWHRRARFDNDDEVRIKFGEILPPISSTY